MVTADIADTLGLVKTSVPTRKAGRVREFLARHAEDLALFLGVVCASFGISMAFGLACALIFVGAALIAYGVWITRR